MFKIIHLYLPNFNVKHFQEIYKILVQCHSCHCFSYGRRRSGQIPTFQVLNTFWASLSFAYKIKKVDRPAGILEDWNDYRPGYKIKFAELAAANGNDTQTGAVALTADGFFYLMDCAVNPTYSSPRQMIWVPLLICMNRNSSWRVSFAARLGAKTTKMKNDQLSCHLGRDKTDQSGQKARDCHVASNWKEPRLEHILY